MQWNPDLYTSKHAFVFDYGASLIELLHPQPTERILDLGCGTGELTQQIAQLSPDTTGMDQSLEMVQKAQDAFPGVNFIVGDAAHFQFPKKFHAIFSNATLHWVSNYRAAAQCMYDNLLPEGRMVIEFGGKGNVQSIVQSLQKQLAARGYTEQSMHQPWYFPSIGAYSALLEAVGFRVTFAQHYDRPTKLVDAENGIVDWIRMFGKSFFVG
ncbi:MAG: methyltransferase domain-containing protein [Bacteroidota bacterium]